MPPESHPTVYLVEDDQAVRDSIVWMLSREGITVESYSRPSELLSSKLLDQSATRRHGCFVLDLRLPEMSGLELLEQLVQQDCHLPFLVITGHGEVKNATHAMRSGAVDFLEKPLDRNVFIDRIWQAIDQDTKQRRKQAELARIKSLMDSLTKREREVLNLVVCGKLTKQIASQLGVSTKTIEAHRSNITRKMRVDSVVQLVRLVIEYESLKSER